MNSIIESRLTEYDLRSEEARKHALREIVQEIALYSLSAWRPDLFIHYLNRMS
ncbi:MAG: hypothetical protein KAS73_00060 [Candidatus Sabulitectum sp.]|nr:hypothetical protein [Candidatus Sabulitectum sp.]